MSSQLAQVHEFAVLPSPHPNELDRHRIERSLKNRKRYRYVTPEVRNLIDGYEIVSPCCSRNVDPSGGTIDIARLTYELETRTWNLYFKNHKTGLWVIDGQFSALPKILELLNEDPARRFWQ